MKYKTISEVWDCYLDDNALAEHVVVAMGGSRDYRAFDAIKRMRQELHDAATPRVPVSDWFGNPDEQPGRWDAWWVDGIGVLYSTRISDERLWGWSPASSRCIAGLALEKLSVVPVAREGFPSPVGWGVVKCAAR